jgi:hypothetical protein
LIAGCKKNATCGNAKKDEVKRIQITKAKLAVNAIFYASHKIVGHRGK